MKVHYLGRMRPLKKMLKNFLFYPTAAILVIACNQEPKIKNGVWYRESQDLGGTIASGFVLKGQIDSLPGVQKPCLVHFRSRILKIKGQEEPLAGYIDENGEFDAHLSELAFFLFPDFDDNFNGTILFEDSLGNKVWIEGNFKKIEDVFIEFKLIED